VNPTVALQANAAQDESLTICNNNIAIGALDNRSEFRFLVRWDLEFVERLLQVIHKRIPFLWRDVEMPMRICH
jgi:hypothetical protein